MGYSASEATSLTGVVAEIKEEERQLKVAKAAARFAPKIVADPCLDSPTEAHHWKYKTGGSKSRSQCKYCQVKR
jgi:hypothetical protein